MILFDSKGYEKSMSFDHDLLNEVDDSIKKMIAGNIKIEDVTNFKNKHYILDVSGSLESSKGAKDINKIDKFLNTVHNINS
jgi:phosphoribosylanthranilate isomerase